MYLVFHINHQQCQVTGRKQGFGSIKFYLTDLDPEELDSLKLLLIGNFKREFLFNTRNLGLTKLHIQVLKSAAPRKLGVVMNKEAQQQTQVILYPSKNGETQKTALIECLTCLTLARVR